MPLEVYNADGELVEGVLSQEEVDAAVAAKTAELQAEIEEKNVKLTKLENKDFNFKRLENMTEAEREKLSATELALKQEQEALQTKQAEFQQGFVADIKNDVLDTLVGDDKELREKVEYNYNRLKDSEKATKRSEIKPLLEEALALSVGIKSGNPLTKAMNASGSAPSKSTKVSQDLVDFAKNFGVNAEDFETK